MLIASHRSRFILALLTLALSGLALANDPDTTPTIQTITSQLAETDYGNDFGQKAINWIAYGTDTPTWGQVSLLSTVSLVLNAIALFVMAWLAVIGGSSFVIQTANKGVPGGQVISSFWMPIRVSVATILLIPLSSGYSTLQYGVITVAEKGNAHANYLIEKGLDYLYNFGAYRSPALEDGRSLILNWIGSEVCRQYINSYTGKETISPVFKQVTERGKITSKLSYSYNEESTWSWSSNPRTDYCGAISFSIDEPSVSEPTNGFLAVWNILRTGDSSGGAFTAAYGGPARIANDQAASLEAIHPKIESIAASILADDAALRALQAYGQSAQSSYEQAAAEVQGKINGSVSSFNQVVVDYNSRLQASIARAVNSTNDLKNSDSGNGSGWKEQTIENGWPALGTIFWQVNINQSEINKLAATMSAIYTEPQLDKEWLEDPRLSEISARIRGLRQAAASSTQSPGPLDFPSLSAIADAGAEGEGFVDKIKAGFSGALADMTRSILYQNGPDDLIINLQYFGSAAGTAAEVAWWAKVISISTAHSLLAGIDSADKKANSFAWYNPIGWAAKSITTVGKVGGTFSVKLLDQLGGMINYLVVGLIIVGFTLGVILPTIPLTIWFMGVISWMLFYLECLLISPMWMAAHGTAEREGWGTEHTRQGYMLMIGLYLGPILRVAGFFAIFIALKPISYLVSWYIDYIRGVFVSGFSFIYIFIGSMLIVFIFAYNALTRIFSLPTELFERGLRWINGGQEVTGDSHNEEKARGSFMAFGSKTEHAAMHAAPKSSPVFKSKEKSKEMA